MTILALFGNGIVLIFVGASISSLRHGDPDWFGLLFVSPFVAIGVGLVGGAAYQFLAMFNPRPTLELSSSTIPLGGATELRWSFSGRTSRIDELHRDAARNRSRPRTAKGQARARTATPFYEMELYRTSDPNEIASGQVGFILPPDTMHSFEAENNKILWRLDIHGGIQGWPDVKESFQITVTPAAN